MRLRILVSAVLAVSLSLYAAWRQLGHRTVSIELKPSSHVLTYEMAWDFGMRQRFTLRQAGAIFASTAVPWREISTKPYNSGAALYVSRTMDTYYIADGVRLYSLDRQTGTVTTRCDLADFPRRTRLGRALADLITTSPSITSHPEGLFRYIAADEKAGPVPAQPSPSRYYADLLYLGKFGVVEGGRRGQDVRFVPAGHAEEPQLPIQSGCG